MTAPGGMIVCLSEAKIGDVVGPLEVMIQEGLDTFSLPATFDDYDDVASIFGTRATFGVHGIKTPEEIAAARGRNAAFLFADFADDKLLASAKEAECGIWLPALTPTEIRQITLSDADGAMLFPADIVGHVMAEHLKALGLVERVIPRGNVGAFSAGEWLKAGAPAVCVDEALLGNCLKGGDLSQLRERCGSFVKAARTKKKL